MKNIFRDTKLAAQFWRDGFVTLPILDDHALESLRTLFQEVSAKVNLSGFATTTISPDLALKQDMFARVQPLYAARVEELFRDYKLLGCSFLQKDSGQPGFMPLHQDWTVTEEAHFRTLTIWVPLEDCMEENGAIQMLPGSHRWTNVLRGPNFPPAIKGVDAILRDGLVTLPLRAGEAVIFDHSIMHCSTLNTSGKPRIAITYGLTHRHAPLRFWYHHPGDPADTLEQLAVPDDFFLQYHNIRERPSMGFSLGYYRQDQQAFSENEARAMVAGNAVMRPILRDLSRREVLPNVPWEFSPTVMSSEAETSDQVGNPLGMDTTPADVPGKMSRLRPSDSPPHDKKDHDSPQHEKTPYRPITISANPDWNAAIEKDGYALFPLLDTDTIESLKAFFYANQPGEINRFHASVHHRDHAYRQRMDGELQRVVKPLMSSILMDGEVLGGSFIAKPTGGGGLLPPHADWNIVDERFGRSYNLWIPLVDTTVANGAVHVIPGSHAWMDDFRGPGIPNPYAQHEAAIWRLMQPLEMKAGTALLYDHRLLHASPVNQSQELRLACVMGVKPRQLPMRFYCGQGEYVMSYESNPSFYILGDPEQGAGDLPFLEVVARIESMAGAPPQALAAPAALGDLDQQSGSDGASRKEEHLPSSAGDGRSFWQTYTLRNIWREIVWRIRGRG